MIRSDPGGRHASRAWPVVAATGRAARPPPSPAARPRSTRSTRRPTGCSGTGKWQKASTEFERLVFEFPPGDPRIVRTHFLMGECLPGERRPPPGGPRIPDRLGSHARTTRWRRKRCCGRGTRSPSCGGGRNWIRPTARRPRRPGRNCSAGIPMRRWCHGCGSGWPGWTKRSRRRTSRTRCSTSGSRPGIRRSSTSRDLLRTYPHTRVAPEAAVKLVETYQALGYAEEQNEKCEYARQNFPG